MTFAQRLIDVTFTLGTGKTFAGNAPSNVLKLSGLRVSAKIVKAGGRSMSALQVQIFGMTMSTMNDLATLGMVPTAFKKNSVMIQAGDAGGLLPIVFSGTIANAYGGFDSAPDVPFHVFAYQGLDAAVAPIPPTSFPGSADVGAIMGGFAKQMNLDLENNNVNVKLSCPYFKSTAREQALSCANAAGIEWAIDDGKLAIWPKGGSRRSTNVPLISPETGLIGYPAFTNNGIQLRTAYNPKIQYGSNIQVQSSLTPACGTWTVYALEHDLESMKPHGSWFSRLEAAKPGLVPVAP